MKLKRFLLRYYPPGIILEYERANGEQETKSIDLLNLTEDTNVDELVDDILKEEPLIPANKRAYLVQLIEKLQNKIFTNKNQNFKLLKKLTTHHQPLTNCAFNKGGDMFITGSYDRTSKLWDTETGKEILTFTGHQNIVYCLAFNNPFGDRVATGSFDKTAKIWDTSSGECLSTLKGHTGEIVCLTFDPHASTLATGSMDTSARIWDVETGQEVRALTGHSGEVISLNYAAEGDLVVTGSFDATAKVWDLRIGKTINTLDEHTAELSNATFDFTADYIATSSLDKTVKLWDQETRKVCTLSLVTKMRYSIWPSIAPVQS